MCGVLVCQELSEYNMLTCSCQVGEERRQAVLGDLKDRAQVFSTSVFHIDGKGNLNACERCSESNGSGD